MKLQLLCFTTFLTACPAPPEPTKGNNGKTQSTVQANSGTQNNPDQQNSNGNKKGSPPPENGKNGTQQEPPPPANGAPAIVIDPSQNLAPENINENLERIEEATLVKPNDGESEGDGSTIGMYSDITNANKILQTQAQVKEEEYITLSGKVTCDGDKCDTAFILRLTPFIMPTKDNNPLSEKSEPSKDSFAIVTEKRVKNNKAFTLIAPKSDKKIVLELLLDQDKDGKASQGESFVIYEGAGGIDLSKDRSDIDFKFNPKTMNAPSSGLPN